MFFRIFGRLIGGFPPPDQYYLYSKIWLFIWQGAIIVLGLISSYVLLKKTYILFRSRKDSFNKYLLLSVWLLIGILLFGFYRKQVYDYYFGFLFPLPFILVGNLFSTCIENKKYRMPVIAILLFIVGINLYGMPFRFEPNRQLNQAEIVAKEVIKRTDGKPYNFALVTNSNSDFAYRYFFMVWNRAPVTIQNTTEDPQRKSVTDQLLVVCEISPCHPLGWAAWEVAGFGRAEIAGEWPVSVLQVDKLVHFKEK